MKLDEYSSYDAIGLAELVSKKEVTAQELIDLAHEGITKTNPELNFMVCEIAEPVMGDVNGSLAGVPFAIKDLVLHAAKIPQTMGSCSLSGDIFSTPYDSEIFKRFKAAGLNTIARTATPEFGFNGTTESVANGPTRNPWDTSRSSGGSSGGTAAAIAAGVFPIGHANDGGGSIRIPAAACGLVGLKPSRGRTPLGPDYQLALMGMGHEFAITRTTRDCALLLDQICGPELNSFISLAKPVVSYSEVIKRPMSGLKIAIAPSGFFGEAPTHSSISTEVRRVGALLEDMGHHVTDVYRIPFDSEQFHTANFRFWTSFLASGVYGLAGALGVEPSADLFETCSLRGAEIGRDLKAIQLEEALLSMSAVSQNMATFFADYDAVILPPFAAPPIKLGTLNQNHPSWSAREFYDQLFGHFNTTAPFNMTGQPAIAVPTGLVDGLPAGVQIAGSNAREDILLNLSIQLEIATQWSDRRPAVHVANV